MTRLAAIALLMMLAACGSGGGRDDEDRGGLCGVSGLVGQRVPDVESSNRSCGIDNPVQVTRVGGIHLSQPALMTCETARALNRWVEGGAKPAVGRRGGGIEEFQVAAHYACRTRNSRRGARISEHARGQAIDISALRLRDGTRITVLDDWNGSRQDSRLLRRLHRAACGPFGTVLGPQSDRFHRDHFHFDIARYRSGPYCR
ncbi:MAG: extensin family protein [Alphaproteobacteria bacterium]|nr:extensin family protein [Alphaproteobacteria bacterium]